MRKLLTAGGLLLVGYVFGKEVGAAKATKHLLDAHFESCPDVPLVVKLNNVEMTVTKLQPKGKGKESE